MVYSGTPKDVLELRICQVCAVSAPKDQQTYFMILPENRQMLVFELRNDTPWFSSLGKY